MITHRNEADTAKTIDSASARSETLKPGSNWKTQKCSRLPGVDVRDQRGGDDEQRRGGEEGAGFAHVGPLAGGHDEARAEERGQDRQQEPDVVSRVPLAYPFSSDSSRVLTER